MKYLTATLLFLLSLSAQADPIADIFSEGVFDTKWGYSMRQVKGAHPAAKKISIDELAWFELYSSKEVLGFERNNKKIHFSFDAEDRLYGVAIHFDNKLHSALLVKLETLFGEWKKGPAHTTPYVQWKSDTGITLSLTSSITDSNLESIFSIGYYMLPSSAASKEDLGF